MRDHIVHLIGDGSTSSPAFLRAMRFARANAAPLTLLGVVPPRGIFAARRERPEKRAQLSVEKRVRLDRLSAVAAGQGIDVRTEILHGSAENVIHRIHSEAYTLVVKEAGPFRRPWYEAFRAPEDAYLVGASPVPVWLSHPDEPLDIDKVLVAVALGDPAGQALASKALLVGAGLAEAEGAELSVVHAASPLALRYVEGLSFTLGDRQLGVLGGQVEEEARSRLQDWLDGVAVALPVPVDVEVEIGRASTVIERVAARTSPKLIVMGSTMREDFGGLLPNTVQRTVDRLPCSVLTVPPSATPWRFESGNHGMPDEGGRSSSGESPPTLMASSVR